MRELRLSDDEMRSMALAYNAWIGRTTFLGSTHIANVL